MKNKIIIGVISIIVLIIVISIIIYKNYDISDTNLVIETKLYIKTKVNQEINLLDGINVSDNSNLDISIIGEYSFLKPDIYELQYCIQDKYSNKTYKTFYLIVEDENNTYEISKSGKDYLIITKNGLTTINGIIIVNKTYSLPSNYGNSLTEDTINYFNKMKSDASLENINLFIVSGFRSYETQIKTYDKWVNLDGKEIADTYSARPGYSEHQTGLALDLNSIYSNFSDSEEFKWLNKNAYKYGFILRYPENKENITGYIYEPWHYRYVGIKLAKELYNNSNWITLEEYFGIESVYK